MRVRVRAHECGHAYDRVFVCRCCLLCVVHCLFCGVHLCALFTSATLLHHVCVVHVRYHVYHVDVFTDRGKVTGNKKRWGKPLLERPMRMQNEKRQPHCSDHRAGQGWAAQKPSLPRCQPLTRRPGTAGARRPFPSHCGRCRTPHARPRRCRCCQCRYPDIRNQRCCQEPTQAKLGMARVQVGRPGCSPEA